MRDKRNEPRWRPNRLGVAIVAVAALAFTGSATVQPIEDADARISAVAQPDASEAASEAEGTRAIDIDATESKAPSAVPYGWPTPNNRSYYLTSSCQPHAAAIRRGAAAWNGLTEGGGTPVECRNSYITDCGGGGRIVGCNWGRGQRIALFMGGVNDDALLAAHEFGHDWYGHSSYRCAGWGSPAEVMAPSICNFRQGGTGTVRID